MGGFWQVFEFHWRGFATNWATPSIFNKPGESQGLLYKYGQ